VIEFRVETGPALDSRDLAFKAETGPALGSRDLESEFQAEEGRRKRTSPALTLKMGKAGAVLKDLHKSSR
jgi:hypothetical protein